MSARSLLMTPARVEQDNVLDACGEQDFGDGDARGTRTGDHHTESFKFAAGDLGGAGQRGQDHDGGAVLVIVHDRAVQGLDELFFELEAARRGDVLQVHGAEAGAQADQGLNDFVHVGGVEDQRDGVKVAEGLEQGGFALHDGQGRAGADVAEAQHGGAVADHNNKALGPGEGLGEFGVGVDGAADLGNTRSVGNGKIALAGERDRAGDGQLAALVGFEDLLVRQHSGLRRGTGGNAVSGSDDFNGHVVVSWG